MRLRVVTLNVWGLAAPIGRDLAARGAAIGAELARLAPDVVALQEVWADGFEAQLRRLLPAAGLANLWPERGAPGGLLVASRLPIGSGRFERFAARGLPQRFWHGDWWGEKGFLDLELETESGPIRFLNTHLHARYDPIHDEYRPHRMAQVVQLAAALRSRALPLVAAGDFNVRDKDAEYAALVGLTNLSDAAATRGRRDATVLRDNPYRCAGHLPDERIDYAFTRAGAEDGLEVADVRRVLDDAPPATHGVPAFSDHAGVAAELQLALAREAAPGPAATEAATSARR
ncbi:MAG: endonuclease/exonuclease/phosphatase family protein, partial [Proteobacteria bacterium]|nr:endonuclease/exonuclease/phosphatase family protein [Pseudomonadota bacterium]